MAFIGYRVYQENGSKNDDKGQFEGWSNRFDEWISIYSPRLQPFLSKTMKGFSDDQDIDDNFDNMVKPEEGHTRVFAVPRVRKCTSSLFIKLMNLFGNEGGFDLILEKCSKEEAGMIIDTATDQSNGPIDLNILSLLMTSISSPYLIYHKDFISEYGPKFVNICI